jgi:hypothetical protein
MHIVVTEVDAVTKVVCTSEPQRTGPSMPAIKGLQIVWQDKSTWPVDTSADGTYLRAPKYYATCDSDADLNVAGMLEVLTETEWNERRVTEHEATKPYPSWVGYLDTMTWAAPVARPANAVINGGDTRYQWDEATVNWVVLATPA